jgi:dephospho-CoA kinase
MVEQNVKLIAFVGLAGTGKSAIAEYLGELGVPKVSFTDIIMNGVAQAGLEPTLENERIIREQMRLDSAGDRVATEAIEQVRRLIDGGQHRILIDGLGSWDTYKRLRHEFHGNLTVVAITARRHIRHRRLTQRPEHPMTSQQIDERDYDEIETLNKGGVIAIADYYLSDNSSLEQLHIQIDNLLRDIEF